MKKRKNLAKQNPNITYQWCFPEIFVGNYYVSQEFNFSSPIYFQLDHVVLLFYKGIYFIKHHDIVTSNYYYATDNHFIKSSILKPLTKF